ncbi:TPA: hypothetical protein TUT18_000160 [Streptococcus equi subsp. zooepidemicus]|nr:hypothetical protein [Streptococcus equi subsp. zooepidemicus]
MMEDLKSMSPQSGDVITKDGKVVNLVTVLGGGTPVSDETYDVQDFSPRSGLILGEDGKVYDLVELLQSGGGDDPQPIEKVRLPLYAITEDMCIVEKDDTKGVAPYSTSYGYTNITVDSERLGVSDWFEGMVVLFVVDVTLAVASSYRNVRIRIDQGDWIPLMEPAGTICSGSTYLTKPSYYTWVFSQKYQSGGALHHNTDANTTYAYLVNTIPTGNLKVDTKGYGARYSLAFATTPLSDGNGIVADERWSSLVTSSSTGSTKKAVTPASGKFYIDRHPQYIYSANIAAGAASGNATYQDYTGADLRYSANMNATFASINQKAFLWLKQFNPEEMSFESDASVGNIMTLDKISTRFPESTEGDVYLYWLGWTGSSYYVLTPNFTSANRIFKYTPATGKLVDCNICAG